MRKLDVHRFYLLATAVHPLVALKEKDTKLNEIFSSLFQASNALRPLVTDKSVLPDSSRRAAASLLRSIQDAGLPKDWRDLPKVNFEEEIPSYRVSFLVSKAKDFETVLANDLPGADTYYVSPIGIYSTPALIERAELAILEGLRDDCQSLVSEDAKKDFNQAGRCLAFELPTAAGFHLMRSVEAVLRDYWSSVKKPSAGQRAPEMAQCINELRSQGEDAKVLDILDHVRDLHRNTLMHPEIFLDMTQALRLFDITKSAISAMADRMHALRQSSPALPPAPTTV